MNFPFPLIFIHVKHIKINLHVDLSNRTIIISNAGSSSRRREKALRETLITQKESGHIKLILKVQNVELVQYRVA